MRNWKTFCEEKLPNLSEEWSDTIQKQCHNFSKFTKYNLDDIIKLNTEDLEQLMQRWVNSLNITHDSSRIYATGVNKYLKYIKRKVDLDDISFPQKIQEERYAISIEEIHEILNIARWDKKGYYIALLCTGARPIEIIGLRKTDMKFIDGKWSAIIPAILTKKKMARTVFFTRECTPYINKFMKREGKFVFITSNKTKYARSNEDICFRRYCDKLGFDEKYETTGNYKINLYCFRGYFYSRALKSVGDQSAMAMMGWGAYLPQYQRRTLKEKKELWDQIEKEVCVYENNKQDISNDEIVNIRKELQQSKENYNNLRNEFREFFESTIKR